MNPIYKAYYSHEGCNCYKIDLPWTKYAKETIVLCKVSEGESKAKRIAEEIISEHLAKCLKLEVRS